MSNLVLELPGTSAVTPVPPSAYRPCRSASPGLTCGEGGDEWKRTPPETSRTETARFAPGDGKTGLGPRSAPLFYTALPKPPLRLSWEETNPQAGRLVIETVGGGEIWTLEAEERRANGLRVCSLAGLSLEPGQHYAWRVEAETESVRTPDGLEPEGRFWLLDSHSAAQLERGRLALRAVTEPDFLNIATALLMAEVGLYHDALRQLRDAHTPAARPARVLLAHIVQSLVYKQLGKRLECEQTGGECAPPLRFTAWARNREQRHQRKASQLRQAHEGINPLLRPADGALARPAHSRAA